MIMVNKFHPAVRLWPIWSVCAVLVAAQEAVADFTPGSLVVSVIGDGVTTVGTTAVPITLREFTTAGVATGMEVPLPTVAAGANYAIAGNVTSTSFGFLRRSADQRYLTMAGANADAGATGFGFSTSSFPNRVIARVDSTGIVDTSTRFAGNGTTPRSVVSTNGTDLWWSSDTGSDIGGVNYVTLGSATKGTRIVNNQTAPLNTRNLGIFGGQLYASSNVATPTSPAVSFRGVYSLGSGLPTVGPAAGTIIVGGGASNSGIIDSGYDFFFADANTIYVADDDTASPVTGGLQKWLFDQGSWSKVWTAVPDGATGMRGLTGLVNGDSVQLYGITAVAAGNGVNSLVSLSDSLTGTIAPSFSTLATADANYVFRGVALAPVPEPSAALLGLAGLAVVGGIRRWRDRQSRR
jgi:hypothetical protein